MFVNQRVYIIVRGSWGDKVMGGLGFMELRQWDFLVVHLKDSRIGTTPKQRLYCRDVYQQRGSFRYFHSSRKSILLKEHISNSQSQL